MDKGRYIFLRCKYCNHNFRYHLRDRHIKAYDESYAISVECPSCKIKGLISSEKKTLEVPDDR